MFGTHASIAGGLHNALLQAESLDCSTVQIFTKNQQQWQVKPLTSDQINPWKTECARLNFKQTVSHDSYLINLASMDDGLWAKSINLFVEELNRCVLLGIPFLVMHPGAHMGAGESSGLKRVAKALDRVHVSVKAKDCITCLEITAGQGSSLGYKLEHLAEIIALVKAPERLAVCLDTAHLFAAGYDFRGRKYSALMKQIESTVGLDRIKVWHLNDSKKDLGSRVDRHEHIGKGMIGLTGFTPIVRDQRWQDTPKILETAKTRDEQGRDWDAVNLETLRGLI